MRKNHYESAVIINAALEDEQIEQIVTKLQDAIVNNGGENLVADKWGRKRLAYQINKSKIGYYVIFQFEAPASAIALIERIYRLDESILRFLTIKLSKFALEHFSDQKEKEALDKIAEEQTEAPEAEAVTPEEQEKKQ
jgi:small subunit ribosomal protein S6